MSCSMKVNFKPPRLDVDFGNVTIQGNVQVKPLSVTENGTYSESGVAYSPVIVDVAGIVPTGTLKISQNGTYDVAQYAEATVNVSGGGGNEDGIIDGSITQLVNTTATKVRREFASIVKHWNYRNLPSGYTQVEYIRANGTQYIDTDILANSPRKAVIDAMFITRGVNCCLLGGGIASNNQLVFLSTYYGTSAISYGASSSAMVLTQNRLYNFDTLLRNGYQTLAIDGANQVQTTRSGEITSNASIFMFAYNNNGTATYFCDARIYGLKIYQNTTPLLADFVPCIEDATGKYGMYDVVRNRFFGNSGTGDFTGGDPIPNLTYGYTSCDFASVTEIGEYAFYNSDLSTLTLRANQVATLGAHALEETPISRGAGRINVPSSLVSAYKTATGWSTYANRIFAIA